MNRTDQAGPPAPYSVKRHGTTLANCDSEPVQTPGCVQGHGAILVLDPVDLRIVQASENVEAILGIPLESLLEQPASAALGSPGREALERYTGGKPLAGNPTHLFTLPASSTRPALDVSAHLSDGALVVECEATSRETGTAPDYYGLVRNTVARMQEMKGLLPFCELMCQEIRQLTGMDRVMVYKFHEDHHGEVFAEDRRADLSPWLGLHYPADDIPAPARAVFTRTWIRPMPDVAGSLAELVPLVHPRTQRALDMTFCALRGASIMYTEYLQNMGVTAGLTLAIRRGDKLWGLIACHHYDGPRHLPYSIRAACEFLAQVFSLQHQAAEDREQSDYRMRLERVHNELASTASQEGGLASLTEGSPTLLDAVTAGGAALYHRDRWWRVGNTPGEAQLDALGAWLVGQRSLTDEPHRLFATDSLARHYPPAAAFADVGSGVLAALLSRNGHNMLLWFRPETLQTVKWGGNPHDKPMVAGPHGPRLTPRRSFELFSESVHQRSLPWLPVEFEAATRLRLLVMDIVVNRAEQLAGLNADLERSNEELDAFAYVASHDLKEPLRGIYKYAQQLAESSRLEPQDVPRVHSLLRLTLRMDNLLDSLLHFSRVGRTELEMEPTDLNDILGEAIEMVSSRLSGSATSIAALASLPTVRCDRTRCREIFVNLISNAIKYNDKADKTVEIGYLDADAPRPRGSPPAAQDQMVFFVRDNGLGIHPRHNEQIFKMFKRLHGRDEYGGGTGAGLAIVRKLVERHGGDIWLDSALGAGSTFYFTLPGVQGVRP